MSRSVQSGQCCLHRKASLTITIRSAGCQRATASQNNTHQLRQQRRDKTRDRARLLAMTSMSKRPLVQEHQEVLDATNKQSGSRVN